jgi:hypothetical protein
MMFKGNTARREKCAVLDSELALAEIGMDYIPLGYLVTHLLLRLDPTYTLY